MIKKRTLCIVLFLLVSGTFLASQEQRKETVTIASFNIRIFSTYSGDDYAGRIVSDHRPVWAEFSRY